MDAKVSMPARRPPANATQRHLPSNTAQHAFAACLAASLAASALAAAPAFGGAEASSSASSSSSSSSSSSAASAPSEQLTTTRDSTGSVGVFDTNGPLDQTGPFFQSLGTNGRSCGTCHLPAEAMTFTPGHASQLFAQTHGSDPLFAAVDGANCDNVTASDRAGHSLILKNGLIRIALPVPANAQFSISVVSDPYGCALRIDPTTQVLTASVYRRPLPSTNLEFLSTVMADGRETIVPLTSEATDAANLRTDLTHQAIDATTTHAQASTPPTAAQLEAIVDFELGLYTAQLSDDGAGALDAYGATGGPQNLSTQLYYPGINDVLGADPHGNPFNRDSMTIFSAWEQSQQGARAQIAAGEKLFDTFAITITGVRGINDNAAIGKPAALQGTCTTCHDAPNVGDHSLPLPLDIGTSHTADPEFESDPNILAAVNQLSMPQLPVFLIAGCPDPFNPGQTASFYTTDPGKALISGNCSDFNRVKGPILHGLAARAPYFHNGAAATLSEVVNFYNERFQMSLTEKQKQELVAFLNSL